MAALRGKYRCITWDERSHGMSDVHGPSEHRCILDTARRLQHGHRFRGMGALYFDDRLIETFPQLGGLAFGNHAPAVHQQHAIAVLGFALVGDGLRIFLDPKQRTQLERVVGQEIIQPAEAPAVPRARSSAA